MYNNEYKEHRRMQITVGVFTIEVSQHAQKRLQQRNIDIYQAVGIILSLGEQKLKQYNNANKDIFIVDKRLNISIICAVENSTITIITTINKADCFVKTGTIAVNL